MPRLKPELLVWARETAGLAADEAARKLAVTEGKLAALEAGAAEPSRPLLQKMSRTYRRPLVAFYLDAPPRRGVRGEDFRSLPERAPRQEALLDALLRDVRARQALVRAALEDEEEAVPLSFIGSVRASDGAGAVLAALRKALALDLAAFRAQPSARAAFALLREHVEATGVFVLLIGNLGSHQSSLDVETFRSLALADPVAPFIVVNDQDAPTAWSFTLLHEVAHLWIGATGVSGGPAPAAGVERLCNDVASALLLPEHELAALRLPAGEAAGAAVADFARDRHLSASTVAYRLFRSGAIREDGWTTLAAAFRRQWQESRAQRREAAQARDGGPSYYTVRRHRLGPALLRLTDRMLGAGTLTPTKAATVLGVRPRSVAPLLRGTTPAARAA